MKRPTSHITGDIAENAVTAAFLDAEWVVNPCTSDYGLDLLIHRTANSKVTGEIAFVQVKGTSSNLRCNKEGIKSFRVQLEHLKFWFRNPVPVFLAVHERPSSNTYIVDCQTLARRTKERFGGKWPDYKTISIKIKKENLLSTDVMNDIANAVSEYWSHWNPSKEEKLAIASQGMHAELARQLAPVYFAFINRIASLRKKLEEAIGEQLCKQISEMRQPVFMAL